MEMAALCQQGAFLPMGFAYMLFFLPIGNAHLLPSLPNGFAYLKIGTAALYQQGPIVPFGFAYLQSPVDLVCLPVLPSSCTFMLQLYEIRVLL